MFVDCFYLHPKQIGFTQNRLLIIPSTRISGKRPTRLARRYSWLCSEISSYSAVINVLFLLELG